MPASPGLPGAIALRIDDTGYNLQYYSERLKLLVEEYGGPTAIQPSPSILQANQQKIVTEYLLLHFASEKQVDATDDEVNTEIATRLGITAHDPDFQTRVQEELARTGLTEQQYRDMIKASLLQTKMIRLFTSELPATAEAVHYRLMLVADQATADAIKEEIQAGADFALFARQQSLDTTTKSNGGDAGWAVRGQLDSAVEEALYALDVNGVTTYSAGTNAGTYVYQVVEKEADRTLDYTQKVSLANKKLADWFKKKQSAVTVEEFVDIDKGNIENARYAVEYALGPPPYPTP